jgi:hypothetical protein
MPVKPPVINYTCMPSSLFSNQDLAKGADTTALFPGAWQAMHGQERLSATRRRKATGVLLLINLNYTGHRPQQVPASGNPYSGDFSVSGG